MTNLEGRDAKTMTVDDMIRAYVLMHGHAPSAAAIAKLRKRFAK